MIIEGNWKRANTLTRLVLVFLLSVTLLIDSAPRHASAATVVLVGAGDIASCAWDTDEATARLLDGIPGTVFTAGDNGYPDGTSSQFSSCYHPTWGRHKSRTRPSPGNHDYHTPGASGYFGYFGVPAYYAYDLGDWRIYALNSEIDTSPTSPQVYWLRNDLITNPKLCVLAYWHKPRWSSSSLHQGTERMQMIWSMLQNAGAELVINGHAHHYERFEEMNAYGTAASPGLRQIVVGTGGAGLTGFGRRWPTSQVRNSSAHGVLKLTLTSTSYSWQFVPIAGQSFTDSGTTHCYQRTTR